jgi:hypothetical protein
MAALGMAGALVAGTATTATAGVSEFVEEGALASYEADGLVVLVGPPMDQGCFGEGLITDTVHVIETPSGVEKEFTAYDERMFLFEAPSIGAVVEANCTAIVNGDEWPYPVVASGVGRTTNLEHYTEDTLQRIDQTRGALVDGDGNEWTVQARFHVAATFVDDGPPDITHVSEWIRLRPAG